MPEVTAMVAEAAVREADWVEEVKAAAKEGAVRVVAKVGGRRGWR